MDDYEDLQKIFPEVHDFMHINGKFGFPLELKDNEWAIGEERRALLQAAGFKWAITGKILWVYDR